MWECVRMEETTFDALLRQAARQTTRRETVGALVAGALVLATQGESNANKKADRRKRRQRKQQSTRFRPRQPVSLLIDNTSGEMPITIEWGWRNPDRCCGQVRDTIVIAQPGQKLTFNAPNSSIWAWIGGMYWFQYDYGGEEPTIGIAIRGRLTGVGNCCAYAPGATVAQADRIGSGQTREYWIEERARFHVTRVSMWTRGLLQIRLPAVMPTEADEL
jgi:hypothetical protein